MARFPILETEVEQQPWGPGHITNAKNQNLPFLGTFRRPARVREDGVPQLSVRSELSRCSGRAPRQG
eukprot:gene22474-biopygen8031